MLFVILEHCFITYFHLFLFNINILSSIVICCCNSAPFTSSVLQQGVSHYLNSDINFATLNSVLCLYIFLYFTSL